MNYNTKSKKSGFTIIEVVLVLAIAGLIFLIVFLAVPALQRGQRDTQRRNDIGRALSAVQQYQSNSRGNLPTFDAAFINAYLANNGATFNDPTTGSSYTFAAAGTTLPTTVASGTIQYRTSATCPATGTAWGTGGGRNVSLVVGLETGGVYCQNI